MKKMPRQILVDNQWLDGAGANPVDCVNPATEEVFDQLSEATAGDVDKAVRAARARFDGGWKTSSGAERAAILRTMSELITERRETLAEWETRDNGKPLAESLFDIDTAAQIYAMYAGLAETLDGAEEEIEGVMPGIRSTVTRRPVGVVGMITPWNYPIEQFTWKVAPCIAAGCTCVIKPSEYTSITALMLGQIAIEAGLPAGVLNIVTGTGPVTGEAIATHPGVDKIAFTGSSRVGRRIMELAARDLKRVSLELGGKSPIIVFDDADIDTAAEWVAFGAFVNQGQVCTSTSRLLVQEGCAEALVNRIREIADGILVGDGTGEGVKMGPLVNARQYEVVTGYIAAARAAGATVLTGGGRPTGLDRGYFVQPTVLTDVTAEMSVWKEEIFGPVLSVMTFATEAEAIALANGSDYGLAAAVLTADTARADRVADAMDAGITWQNCSQMVIPQAPWGGVKKSGFGRELGRWGLDGYLEPKQKTRWLPEAGIGWYAAPEATAAAE